jgi:hypothetical protein
VVVRVVAERHRVDLELVEELAPDPLGDPEPAGGVLPVDHHEVRLVLLAQARQQVGERAPAGLAHDVADE